MKSLFEIIIYIMHICYFKIEFTILKKMESKIKVNLITTLINTFIVENENQQDALINELDNSTKKIMSKFDGFISSNLHKSLDGKKVVNYVQWDSVDHWKNMLNDPLAKESMKEIEKMVTTYEPVLYKVEKINHK